MNKVIGKISKKQLDAMIQEELAKMKKLMALKEMKEAKQKEIEQLQESLGIDEVKNVGFADNASDSEGELPYYRQDLPKKEFDKKKNGSEGNSVALKEMEGLEAEEECGELETMFAELGRKLDAMVAGQDELAADHDELEADHDELEADHEEIGADSEGDADELEMDECGDKYEEGEEIELSEEDIVSEEEATEESEESEESEETVNEQEGETVANAADQDTVNHNMDKVDNKNAMADKMYEGASNEKKPLNEHKHLNPEGNPLINEELNRMKRLANL